MERLPSLPINAPEAIGTGQQPNFSHLPPAWEHVREELVRQSHNPELPRLYGLEPDSATFLCFHGTVEEKVPLIQAEGLRAFYEVSHTEPVISVTASPTRALAHAIQNGPHDTLRKQGLLEAVHNPDDVALLAIRVPKLWLAEQPEAQRPLALPDWLKAELGVSPERDKRALGFESGLRAEVAGLQQGQEAGDFGLSFPTTTIPPEFISVIRPTDAQPVLR